MSDQTTNALIAVALGTVVAIVLLIPTAAVQYRRDGRLGPGDLSILLSGAVYGLALWTYTLLPVPPTDDYRCTSEQLDPFGTIGSIWTDDAGGGLAILRQEAFLQVALNVLLFVPLGYFIRVIARRGVVVAGLSGLAISLLIEVTQLTGDWGVFSCAYRQFDVDDLMSTPSARSAGPCSRPSSSTARRRRFGCRPLSRSDAGWSAWSATWSSSWCSAQSSRSAIGRSPTTSTCRPGSSSVSRS